MNRTRQIRHLLVFARAPIPGRVKTRLVPALGAAAATAVYRRMLHDILALAPLLTVDKCEVWLDSPSAATELLTMIREPGIALQFQSGADLGERMHNALAKSLETAQATILIGTDCPEYDVDYLNAAFEALQHHDAVVGPAHDGGYVLIGLKVADPRVFHQITWGGDGVLASTRERLTQLGWSWHELPPRHDVDKPDDLARFPDLLAIAKQMPPDHSA